MASSAAHCFRISVGISMPTHTPITILGGTFDPVHYGHLRMALEIQEALGLPSIGFLPCRMPVHKEQTHGTLEQRMAMLALAIKDHPSFYLDTREVNRSSPSYMVHTLQSLREEVGSHRPLILIMGTDSFQTLHTWHEWKTLCSLTHILIATRPGYLLPSTGPLLPLIEAHFTKKPCLLKKTPAGYIYTQRITQLDISSTTIRTLREQGYNPSFLLPNTVLQYINNIRLYEKTNH